METELTLSRGGLPPFSARGCTQTLSLVSLGAYHRTIANKLVYLGKPEKKFKSVIQCQDMTSLATDGLWPGTVVEVGCIQRLCQKILGDVCVLERPARPESVQVTLVGDNCAYEYKDQTIFFKEQQEGFVSYRPILRMQVKNYTLTTDEWGVKVGWQLDLEEV